MERENSEIKWKIVTYQVQSALSPQPTMNYQPRPEQSTEIWLQLACQTCLSSQKVVKDTPIVYLNFKIISLPLSILKLDYIQLHAYSIVVFSQHFPLLNKFQVRTMIRAYENHLLQSNAQLLLIHQKQISSENLLDGIGFLIWRRT